MPRGKTIRYWSNHLRAKAHSPADLQQPCFGLNHGADGVVVDFPGVGHVVPDEVVVFVEEGEPFADFVVDCDLPQRLGTPCPTTRQTGPY